MRNPISLPLYASLIIALAGCAKQPEAEFSTDKDVAGVGETITFKNKTDDAKTYLWSFGDGSTSTLQNPTHAYSTPGRYKVSLKAFSRKEKKSDEATSEMRINDVEYEGAHYPITTGFIYYQAPNSFEIMLSNGNFLFLTTGIVNVINILVYSPSASELLPGTYTYSTSDVGFAMQGGECLVNFDIATENGTAEMITGGTVVISKSGTDYTFECTLNLQNGKPLKGYFTGPVLMQ